MKKILWVVPELKGGIRSYSERLYSAVAATCPTEFKLLPLQILDARNQKSNSQLFEVIRHEQPDLIHVQHEFGLFGKKIPGLNHFHVWLADIRNFSATSKMVLTAHTVLPPTYRFKRALLNRLLPLLKPYWATWYWRGVDSIITHSSRQLTYLKLMAKQTSIAIPHFAPDRVVVPTQKTERPEIVVFGYFTPEKGQLTAIRAMKFVKTDAKLILAGSARLPADRAYLALCRSEIEKLGLSDRCEILERYLSIDEMNELYSRANVVLAPFEATTGSGSLVEAFARGCAVLTSDLDLNQEINERVPGSVATYQTGDPQDCALKLDQIIADPALCSRLKENALKYREEFSLNVIAERHWDHYRSLLNVPQS
ncbi:MAG: glycosyltransferase [Proteobacteria bacterium]|nr:MAG: glycosyltransferase [Pseudomonadota bacterium]